MRPGRARRPDFDTGVANLEHRGVNIDLRLLVDGPFIPFPFHPAPANTARLKLGRTSRILPILLQEKTAQKKSACVCLCVTLVTRTIKKKKKKAIKGGRRQCPTLGIERCSRATTANLHASTRKRIGPRPSRLHSSLPPLIYTDVPYIHTSIRLRIVWLFLGASIGVSNEPNKAHRD